jgi:hypothetical protein
VAGHGRNDPEKVPFVKKAVLRNQFYLFGKQYLALLYDKKPVRVPFALKNDKSALFIRDKR